MEILREGWEVGDEKRCDLLLRGLYGTRGAAFDSAAFYTEALLAIGLIKGAPSPAQTRINIGDSRF